jgi:hypothetical protein
MLYREIITIYFEIQNIYTYILWAKCGVRVFDVKAVDTE